ncbi:DMT family transporter [Anaeromicrobium sediminis]|uniref:EamA domain-containing protein n=1 Tax=Anaeromicrobium sediminis TaxID=1478221 RepID=A0A267MM29_9FIRM|nr:DMT family transporter [Anaeromicrobium sediminis]PAB60462.1 hypothetical protein CCE28_06080 [Anaeromicrobium sediminis]
MDKKIDPKLIILIGVIFVSFSSVLTKMCSAPALIIGTYRLGFTSFILLPYVLAKNTHELKNVSRKTLVQCICSGVFLALHFATWLESIKYTSIASSTVLVNTHPIFIVLGSIFILKEKVSRKSLASIFIALIGSAIISMGDSSLGKNILYGDMLAILGGLTVACYMLIGRIARQKLSVNAYTFIVYTSCTITLLLFDFITGTPLYPYPKLDWIIFISLAVCCTILGHSIFNWALEYLSPSFVSTAILGEPIFATIWAIFLFNQIPTLWQISGGLIVIFGIYRFIQVTENSSTEN